MSLRAFTLHDQIERNAALHGSRTAFTGDAGRVTHAQYSERVQRLAAGLAAAGIALGDRVAILAPNGQVFADVYGAAARLGAIVVPVNWRLSAEEVAHVLRDTTPRVLIAAAEWHALVADEAVATLLAYTLGPSDDARWLPVEALYAGADAPPPADIDDAAGLVIVHTAAVGGWPRGALLSHRGLLCAAAASQQAWHLGPDDVQLGALPLFHVVGIGLMLALLMAGGSTTLLPRFEPKALVRLIDEEGGSVLGSFPPMLSTLLDAAAEAGSALAPLRVVTGIDAPATLERFAAACPQVNFWVAYGQTETSGSVSMSRFAERPGSAGRVVAQHVLRIVDELDQPLPAGQIGEIVVCGPMVFLGYWRRDADYAHTLRGGWHHTGDLGRLDADGYLWYAGRTPAKELIKPGGENVYPAEVAQALLDHPAVAEALVFGVPDAQWGEAVRAVCVLKPGQTLAAQALIEFVGQRIARYKKPKRVDFVTALPRAADGSVDRAAVMAAHGAG